MIKLDSCNRTLDHSARNIAVFSQVFPRLYARFADEGREFNRPHSPTSTSTIAAMNQMS